MTHLFVSHSSRDQRAADLVRASLVTAGFASLFLDFDPEVGIPGGRDWERELYDQLHKSDGLILIASSASLNSHWCLAEVALARSLGLPVFPLRVERGVSWPLLDGVQWIDFGDPQVGCARLVAALRSAGLDPSGSFSWDAQRSPYPGLASFSFEDAAVFFGRDREIDRLTSLLQPTLRHGSGRFVAIVGPSGSGKSSLLRAGLLPRLSRPAGGWVILPPLLPGSTPIRNLAGCLAYAFAENGSQRSTQDISRSLAAGPGGLVKLADELADLARTRHGRPKVLVAIDQAEELLLRSGPNEQRAFLHLVRGALDHADGPLWAVATVRSEYLSTSPERVGLAEAIDDALVIEPLSRAQLGEVIGRPARRSGLEFDPGLIERMIEDTAGGDAVPLLAYTLRELAGRATPTGQITTESYTALGGVVGALRGRADQVAGELDRLGHGRLVMPTLIQLAAVSGNDEPTRRRVRRNTLNPEEQTIVDAFIDASLLVSDHNPATLDGEPTVEVAHEALLRQWEPLRRAIEADRATLRLRSELERLAADWQEAGNDESYLLRGGRLDTFEQWRDDDQLTPTEHTFLAASRSLANRDVEKTRRSNRRLRMLASGLAALLVAALLTGVTAWKQSEQARAQSQLAWSRQLATEADRLVATHTDAAILVALHSMSLSGTNNHNPPSALINGLARVTHASRELLVPNATQRAVAFSPDGTILASASTDHTVRLWNTTTGQPHSPPLTGHTDQVFDVTFSPDGKILASAGRDNTIRLWDVDTGQPGALPLTGHTDTVNGVAFSPDGHLIASAGSDHTVRLWDTATGQRHGPPLTGHTDKVYGVAFSPDGNLIASAGADHTVRLWDTATGQRHGPPLAGHTDTVNGVAFSPDGTLLASAGADHTIRLWNVEKSVSSIGRVLIGHTDQVSEVAFSPDGKLLASAGLDQTVQLWDTATAQPHGQPFTGHANWVHSVAFSPDGKLLASASADHTVRLWNLEETVSISRASVGHTDQVYGVAFSPDGQLLATASLDHTVRLWDTATGLPHGPTLTGHTDQVFDVAFSPDGQLLASGGRDNTIRLWDTATGEPHGPTLTGHTNQVMGVAFSPDGTLLASAGLDQTVRLWDVATGELQGVIRHTNQFARVTFSPDGKLLAAASGDGTVHLWDTATGQPHGQPFTGHTNQVMGVAFSPDGTLLASASLDQTVRLWDVATGQAHGAPLTGHTNAVWAVAFSPDGTLVASGGVDQTVRLWETATGQPHGPPLTGHTAGVVKVAFSPDGKSLASASADSTARLWNPSFTAWTDVACQLVNRNLSLNEWNDVAPDLPYERTCPNLPPGTGAPADAKAAH